MTPDTIKYWFNVALLLFGLRNYESSRRLLKRVKRKCKKCKAKELRPPCQIILSQMKDGAYSSFYITIGNGGNTEVDGDIQIDDSNTQHKTFAPKSITKNFKKCSWY